MIFNFLGLIFFIKIIYRFLQFLIEFFYTEKIINKNGWVLITGGGGGIGAEFAKKFRNRGMKIFIIGRNCSKLAEKLGGPGNCEILEIDFLNMMETNIYNKIKSIINSRDWSYLINNVAHRTGALNFKDLPDLEIEKCIKTGIYPIVFLTKLMLNKAKPPKIINITAQTHFNTDFLALNPCVTLPYIGVYEGINNFQQAFGASLHAENLNVLNLMPGAVKTKNTKNFLKSAEPLVVDARIFVNNAMRYINKKGSYVVHWKHKISNFIVNIFPFVGTYCFKKVARDIAIDLQNKY